MPSRSTSTPSTRRPLGALAFATLYLAGMAAVGAAAEVPAFDLKEIKTIFSFGDSWTTTGYTPSEGVEDVNQTATTSGGPTWVQYLAWNHTSAASSYYDLASLGATISTSIVYSNGATDFAGQTGEFLAYFNSSTSSVQWDSDTSLFTIFFGNDDVYNTYANGWNFTDYQPRLLTAYDEQVGKLYEAGARNFLLLSLPSLSHSPLASSISGGKKTISTAVEYWNDRLEVYARFLEAKYPGVRGKWFDARGWTGEVLSNPSKYGYNDATSACEAYSSLVKWDPNANDKSCEFSLSTYFWKDFFRPTWRVHEQMAAAIASLLSSPTPSLTLPTNSSSAISSLVPSGSSAANFSALLPSATSGSVTSVVVATETSTVSSSEPEETEGAAGGIRVGTNTSGAASGGGGPSWLTVAMAAVGAGVVSLWTAG